MTEEQYKDELKLIEKQNNIEFELYPLIAEIIEPTLKKGLSKRYVFARRKSKLGQIYYGISSFPDLAILDRDFRNSEHNEINKENWKKLRGCIEAKQLRGELYCLSDLQRNINSTSENTPVSDKIGQLLGEILWYKKVLYTNGIEWKLFYIDSYNVKDENTIVEIVNKRISFENSNENKEKFVWWKDESDFECIKKITDKIKEEIIVEDCLENWNRFINKIKTIKWK